MTTLRRLEMDLPKIDLSNVVSRDEWLAARKALLVREKEATKLNDELRAERQGLPLVRIEKEYVFDSSEGRVSLLELFGEHRQLIVQHFMFDPAWEDGCPSCSYAVDTLGAEHLRHLQSQDTAFVIISRAPIEKLERWKAKKGWVIPWVSSYGSDFNYDFNATHDAQVAPIEHNFRHKEELEAAGLPADLSGEVPGYSVFVRDDQDIYFSYATFDRGVERLVSSTNFLDLTPLGRQG
jgi:predicted dithiol-disulfide oxidoreductase (DUF899 family)